MIINEFSIIIVASKSGVGEEKEGSNFDDCTQTIIMDYATILISRNTIIIMAESNILGNTVHTVHINTSKM